MNPKLKVISDGRRGWFNRSDVLAAGYSDAELRRRLHLLAIRAVTDQLDKVVVSHQSAAVLHGLPIWGFDLERVHVSRSTGRVRSGATLAVHRSPLDPDEITELDGIRVTTVERAITETACGTSFEVGVVLADAALRAGLTSPELLIATADRHRHWRGSPAARSAVRFANGLSESVGESRLRVLMDNHQLPAPSLQVEIRADSGELIGRVDFLLSGKLIVEFDGAQKYGDSADSIVAEKWREDRLRDRGYGVVRVSWPDLDQPRITAARLHRHLLSGEPGAREPRT